MTHEEAEAREKLITIEMNNEWKTEAGSDEKNE